MARCETPRVGPLRELARAALDQQGLTARWLRWMGANPKPLGLAQPTVSHHLKILVDAEIFTHDKRGVWT